MLAGSGKLVIEDKEILLELGSIFLIQSHEKYYFEGQVTLLFSCIPGWYPEQCEKAV